MKLRPHVRVRSCPESLTNHPGAPRCARQRLVKAGDGVLLMNDQRPAREPCGEAAGTGDEASQADHDHRSVAPHDAQRLDEGEEMRRKGATSQVSTPLPPATRRTDSRSIGMPSAGMTRDSSHARRAEPDNLQRLLTQSAPRTSAGE